MNQCAALELKEMEVRLDSMYSKFIFNHNDASQKLFLELKKNWIAYRDAQCAFNTRGSVGGSVHPFVLAWCLRQLTEQHIALMTDQLNCEEGDLSCAHHPSSAGP